jgi:hypothetical protein
MKKQKTFTSLSLLCLTVLLLAITSCKKNNSDNTDPIIDNPVSKVTTTISGRILDTQGQPVTGATVETEGVLTSTDFMGLFLFKDISVTKKRCSLKFSKAGYMNQFYSCIPSAGNVTYIKGVMLTHDASYTVASATGGTLTLPSGASVQFPQNAFVTSNGTAYTGTVTVNVTYLNPDDSMFRKKTPGRDLYALDAQGKEKVLVSFGMMNVELLSAANEKLQLKSGKQAILSMPIAPSQQATATATIPLWYFDETSGFWKEEGVASKTGNQYIGNVSHFSWWNWDWPYDIANIHGNVVSCDSTVQANVDVLGGSTTDSQGAYNDIFPAQYIGQADIYAFKYTSLGYLTTQTEQVPSLTIGQNYQVPDLIFSATFNNIANVTGHLVDCYTAPTSGLVVITCAQTNYWDYLYVVDSFSLMLDPAYNYKVTAISNGQYGQMTLSNLPAIGCSAYNAGNLPLCNIISTVGTNFWGTLTSTLLGTQSFAYFADNCIKGVNTLNGASQITLSATDTVNNAFAVMIMQTDNYAPGNYAWNSTTNTLYFSGNLNGIPVTINSNLTAAGENVIVTAALVGSNVAGSYSGPVTITSPSYPGLSIPGTLTGNFNVYRNH